MKSRIYAVMITVSVVVLLYGTTAAQELVKSTTATAVSPDTIKGIVLNLEDGKGVSNARVTIKDTLTSRVIAYTFTNATGGFTITTVSTPPWLLEISSLGYKPLRQKLNSSPESELTINLESSQIVLNEVKIVAPKVSVKGDTLNYLTGGFLKEGDVSIEDMLKRLPGVEVTDGGQILYNNKPINAFYIDGKNMLDGRYSIATKNLPPDIVSMVQIFENHQPVKALKDFVPSDNSAINLKLDPKAKARWVAAGDVAAGVPDYLWDGRLLLFRFSPDMQSMNTLRSNNRGREIATDLKTHTLGAAAQTQLLKSEDVNLVNVTGISVPLAGDERALFNKSGYISANTLFNTSESTEVSLKVGYIYEEKEREQQEWTEYFLGDGVSRVVGERSSFSGIINRPDLDFTIKTNTPKYFLQNRVNLKGRFENNNSVVSGTRDLLSKATLRQYEASEIVTWIKPMNRSLVKLSSNTHLSQMPQTLVVWDKTQSQKIVFQDVSLFQVSSVNNLNYIRRAGCITAELSAGVNIRYQELETANDLSTDGVTTGMGSLSLTELYISPAIGYEKDGLRLNVTLPVMLQNGALRLAPDINLRYRISSFWEGSGGYRRSNRFSEITSVEPDMRMISYRIFEKGAGSLAESRDDILFIRGVYNNPLKLINVSGSVSYHRSENQTLPYVDFIEGELYNIEEFILRGEHFENNTGRTLSSGLNFSKSFFDTPLLIGVKTTFSLTESSVVQQGVFTMMRFNRYSIAPIVEFSLFKAADIELTAPFLLQQRGSLSGIISRSSLTSFSPTAKINIKLSELTTIAVNSALYFNEMSKGVFYLYPFTDIKCRFKIKKGEIFAELTNLFNNTEFRYKVAGDLSLTERFYKLRSTAFMAGLSFSF
ncbi:MAG: hypothetical protein CVU13_05635 [Bacteroidetes bacterium HGW-Bacteroidetes-8]|jgi:hypothetical protein|nr:MAG: hypothetical protein CVU13_05635 [Bacteroidetes bacterium HGW-Bacteroidetes-8]